MSMDIEKLVEEQLDLIISSRISTVRLPIFKKMLGDEDVNSTLVLVYCPVTDSKRDILNTLTNIFDKEQYKTVIKGLHTGVDYIKCTHFEDTQQVFNLVLIPTTSRHTHRANLVILAHQDAGELVFTSMRNKNGLVGEKVFSGSYITNIDIDTNNMDKALAKRLCNTNYTFEETPRASVSKFFSDPEVIYDKYKWFTLSRNDVILFVFRMHTPVSNALHLTVFHATTWDGDTMSPSLSVAEDEYLEAYIKKDDTCHIDYAGDGYIHTEAPHGLVDDMVVLSKMYSLAKKYIEGFEGI